MTWRRPPFLLLAAGWLTLPFTAGVALPRLLDAAPATRGGRVVAWVLAGIVYGVGVLGLFRPGAPGLFVLRLGTVGVVLGAAVPAVFVVSPAVAGVLLALTLFLVALAFSAPVDQTAAEASAFPGESRFTLAASPGVTWALAPVAAAASVSGIAAPVLAASGAFGRAQPLVGVLVAVPGVVATAFLAPALWRLGRRWLVVVPSGVVLHDPMLMDDTFRLAPGDVGAVALTTSGWRERLRAPEVLDITAGARRALWIGLTAPVVPPGTRPGVPRTGSAVSHVFCAPWARAEAAAALQAKGYPIADPVGPP